MNTYQTPDNEFINGINYQSAITALREKNNHIESYYDQCYDWKLHEDEFHLIQNNINQ